MTDQSTSIYRTASLLVGGLLASAAVSGLLATTLPEARPPTTIMSLNAQLQTAANAALAFKASTGRLPSSLAELRGQSRSVLAEPNFHLDGVLYFREGDGQLRLSWRDDTAAAFCSLKVAQAGRCA